MGLNHFRDRLCLLQFSNGNEKVFLVKFEDRKYHCPNLKKLLLENKGKKIFHFARFDLASIQYYLNIALDNIFCTHLASRLVRTYTDFHGLKDLCRELLDIQISKQQQSSDWGKKDLIKDQQEYAARDVLYLHKIRDILVDMLKREDRLAIAEEIFKFIPVRAKLDIIGWNDIDILSH